MSRWIATTLVGLMLAAGPAMAAPRGPSTSPEGNPVTTSAGPAATPPPAAPAPPPPPPPTTVDALTITASPASPPVDAISAFVADASAKTATGRLGRWDRKICAGVIGVKPPYAQILLDRIASVAVTVGLQPGAPGCKPNLVIIATDDSQALARESVETNPAGFGRWADSATPGRAALRDFVETPRPVRWWHVTHLVTADGAVIEPGAQVRVRAPGRIKANTRDDFDRVLIMLDVKLAGPLRFNALADYMVMIGLAQIDPDADTAGDRTILNLFSDRQRGLEPPIGLTAWDVAYLQALYATDRNVIRGSTQERDIVRGMMQRLGVTGDQPQ